MPAVETTAHASTSSLPCATMTTWLNLRRLAFLEGFQIGCWDQLDCPNLKWFEVRAYWSESAWIELNRFVGRLPKLQRLTLRSIDFGSRTAPDELGLVLRTVKDSLMLVDITSKVFDIVC